MGKAQSKRSVDITTETKDGVVEEGSGKMGKIEDVDQLKPQKLNGDTNHKDTAASAAGDQVREIRFFICPFFISYLRPYL